MLLKNNPYNESEFSCLTSMKRIVLIAGFESFNAGLYRQAAELAHERCPELDVRVFSDRDLAANPVEVETALKQADVFFASLLFDYDQVLWLRERVQMIPIRLVFESALELMSLTQIGKFAIGNKPKGMPKPVKFILDKFSNGREEDKLAGYISFLKTGPKLLKFVPVQKVQDLRNWLVIYGYWNAGGTENVAALFCTIAQKYLGLTVGEIAESYRSLHPILATNTKPRSAIRQFLVSSKNEYPESTMEPQRCKEHSLR
jgi:magnesium chelatase subunit H